MQSPSVSIKIRYSAHFLWGNQKQLYASLGDIKLAKTRGNLSLSSFAKEYWSYPPTPLGGSCGSFTVSCITETGSRNEVIMIFELNISSSKPGRQSLQLHLFQHTSAAAREDRHPLLPRNQWEPDTEGTWCPWKHCQENSYSRDFPTEHQGAQEWGFFLREGSTTPARPWPHQQQGCQSTRNLQAAVEQQEQVKGQLSRAQVRSQVQETARDKHPHREKSTSSSLGLSGVLAQGCGWKLQVRLFRAIKASRFVIMLSAGISSLPFRRCGEGSANSYPRLKTIFFPLWNAARRLKKKMKLSQHMNGILNIS